MKRVFASVAGACALGLASTPAFAQESETLSYRLKRGDTLYQLAQDYLRGRGAAERVRRLNRIRNPNRMAVGSTVRIPRDLLKYNLVEMRIQSFTGPVSITKDGQSITPALGMIVPEGATLSTGPRGFVTLTGYGNSRVSLPTNSKARLIGAKRYLINGLVDFDLQIMKGRGAVTAPKLKSGERYRVGTPVAVTAVRGTEYRVSHDEESERSAAEVLEGEVNVSSGGAEFATTAGLGITASDAGLGEAEKLLEAPELIGGGKIQTGEKVAFEIDPLTNAVSYRTQLALDAGFLEVIEEAVTSENDVAFPMLDDGRYFIRARGIAESGLEGKSKAYSFRRKRLGSSASVESGGLDDAFKFGWRLDGEGQSYAGFQLWLKNSPDNLLVDEVGLEDTAIFITDIPPGDYQWRIATFQIDEGDMIKVWGPTQDLVVSE